MKLGPILALLIIAICTIQTNARFYYGYFGDLTHLSLVGDAERYGPQECLALTGSGSSTKSASGSVWYDQSVKFSDSTGFFTSFTFTVETDEEKSLGNYKKRDRKKKPRRSPNASGDGFAFVVQCDGKRALGEDGSGLGYRGLCGGFAVEFDTHMDLDELDPNGSHIAIHSIEDNNDENDNDIYSDRLSTVETSADAVVSTTSSRINLRNGELYTAQITYQNGVVKVYVNDLIKPILTKEISSLKDGRKFNVGFTGAANTESLDIQQICDWYFERKSLGKEREGCDDGFSNDDCGLDAVQISHDCLLSTREGCGVCTTHIRNCIWCAADNRCVPGGPAAKVGHPFFGGGIATNQNNLQVCSDFSSCIYSQDQCPASDQLKSFEHLWPHIFLSIVVFHVLSIMAKLIFKQYFAHRPTQHLRLRMLSDLVWICTSGSIFSVAVYYVINCALFAITLSIFYSFLFGLLFIFFGGVLLWKTILRHFGNSSSGDGSTGEFQGSKLDFLLLIFFTLILIVCGVCCFLLEEDWTNQMSVTTKIPLYGLMGVAINFSLVFSLVDLTKAIPGIITRIQAKLSNHSRFLQQHTSSSEGLGMSTLQLWLMGLMSVLCGLYYGWTFGMLDIEDLNKNHLDLALQRENYNCYPLAALLGGLSACLLRYVNNKFEDEADDPNANFHNQELQPYFLDRT